MSCPDDCPVCNGVQPLNGIEGDDLATQVFILSERLMDERHKSYRLECELAEAEHHIEVCSEAAWVAPGQCAYCDEEGE